MTDDVRAWSEPAFAKDFPRNEELQRLVDCFARGDYATVRTDAPKLAANTDDEAVKAAAKLLRERIEPDASAKWLFVAALCLLAFLSAWWITHDGPGGDAKPDPPKKLQTIEQ